MLTKAELNMLNQILDDGWMPPGKRTFSTRLSELTGGGLWKEPEVDALLHRLNLRGLISYQAPMDDDGFAIISRRDPRPGSIVLSFKKRKPKTGLQKYYADPAPRGD